MDDKYTLIRYSPEDIEHYNSASLGDLLSQGQSEGVAWMVMRGYGPSDHVDIARIAAYFGAEPAVVDKVLNPIPLESSDQLSTCLYINYIVPSPVLDPSGDVYVENRGSVIMGEDYLLLIDEIWKGFFDDVQQELLDGKTRAQGYGVDYLLYILLLAATYQIDQLVSYELVKRFDELEDDIFANPGKKESLQALIAEREHVKALYDPLRWFELFLVLVREGVVRYITAQTSQLFTQNLAIDLHSLERGYERLSDWFTELMQLHQTYVNERTNYLLQILSTIFLPLSFLTGLFGMNFVCRWDDRSFEKKRMVVVLNIQKAKHLPDGLQASVMAKEWRAGDDN